MPSDVYLSDDPLVIAGRKRRLTLAVTATLIGAEIYFISSADVRSPTHLQLGLLMVLLAFIPMLRWARRGKATLPVFELFLLTTANTYAFPLLNGHTDLLNYSIEDITTASVQVILFQIIAIAIYTIIPARAGRGRFWNETVIGDGLSRWLEHGMTASSVYLLISTFTDLIPSSIGSVLRAIFFGIGIICTFITSRRLGQNQLSPAERTLFFANLLIQSITMCATLFLVTTISTILLALVGYISASGRLPAVLCGAILTLLAILHNGKSDMRATYWESEQTVPAFTELPGFYSEWISHGLSLGDDPSRKKMASKLIERTSLMHILCLVVSSTPARQSFLEGETYFHIPGQFVPRFFWPEKPPGHVSTSRLSVYYGLQTEEDTHKTTIGFGMLAEAYANFGFMGVAALGALIAAAFKRITGLAEKGPLLSYGGILLVILIAWSFQVEFTLSIWLSSFYQACAAVLVLPFAFNKFFN